MVDTHDDRFRAALETDDADAALYALAVELKDEGVGQTDLFMLFARFQDEIDGDNPKYDAVVDNMDLIVGGPWAKGRDLFETVMTNEDMPLP